jgi:CHASE2 domain-containing sensor protein
VSQLLANTPWQLWHRHGRALVVVVAITAMMQAADHLGWLEGLEATAFDTTVRGKARTSWNDIFIVEITEDDYRTFFESRSPLDPDKLTELINVVLSGSPDVVGVDIDTSDESWCCRAAARVSEPAGQSVVWAQVPVEVGATASGERPLLKMRSVCGGRIENIARMGIPRFPVDHDGVVRRYVDHFLVEGPIYACGDLEKTDRATCDGRVSAIRTARVPAPIVKGTEHYAISMKSLPRAVLEKSKRAAARTVRGDDEVLLNFSGDRYTFPVVHAREFLSPLAPAVPPEKRPQPEWQKRELLKDKIVLIGGAYQAARDEYVTPVGRMAGVELIAHAIESELHGGGIRRWNRFLAIVADLAAGLIIVVIYQQPYRTAFWLSLGGIVALPFAGSLLAYHSLAHLVNFVPVVVGASLHQLYEHGHRHRKLDAELHAARARINELEAQLMQAKTPGSDDTT